MGGFMIFYYCTCNYISASCTLRCKNRTTGVCNGY